MAEEPTGRKIGRPSRIYETIDESRCPACGDWIRGVLFRAHYEGRHPKSERPTEFEIRSIPLPERLVEYLAAGNYFEAACAAVGLAPKLGYEWMRIGEEWEAEDEAEIPADRRIYREFRHAVLNAREAAQARMLREIERAAPQDWRAAAWILERTHPARYSRIERLRVGGDGDAEPIRVEHVETDPDFIGDVMRIYREAGVLPDVDSGNGTNGHGPSSNGNGRGPK